MKNQYYTIFLASIAAKLVQKGFTIRKVELSKKDPNYLVYKFDYSPEIKKALQVILEEEKK